MRVMLRRRQRGAESGADVGTSDDRIGLRQARRQQRLQRGLIPSEAVCSGRSDAGASAGAAVGCDADDVIAYVNPMWRRQRHRAVGDATAPAPVMAVAPQASRPAPVASAASASTARSVTGGDGCGEIGSGRSGSLAGLGLSGSARSRKQLSSLRAFKSSPTGASVTASRRQDTATARGRARARGAGRRSAVGGLAASGFGVPRRAATVAASSSPAHAHVGSTGGESESKIRDEDCTPAGSGAAAGCGAGDAVAARSRRLRR